VGDDDFLIGARINRIFKRNDVPTVVIVDALNHGQAGRLSAAVPGYENQSRLPFTNSYAASGANKSSSVGIMSGM